MKRELEEVERQRAWECAGECAGGPASGPSYLAEATRQERPARGRSQSGRPGMGRIAGVLVALVSAAHASAVTTIFNITNFANPSWSLTYPSGFSGVVGTTTTWPAEMGWQGDRIDIAFNLSASVPSDARHYRFRVVISDKFTQTISVRILAGPSLGDLQEVRTELIETARVLVGTIPLNRFTPGQTNYIRIQGIGVAVGDGQPSGIAWRRWTLTRTNSDYDADTVRWSQLERLSRYVSDAITPSGLVRDSITLNPSDPPFHPATPDAAGFVLIGLSAADHLGIDPDAEAKVEEILNAYAGNVPGVVPARNTKGHWWHWMNISTGQPEPGWNDTYTTIGSALLVGGALFAKNHFAYNPNIGALADELYATCNFDAMIHPTLDGRVYVATDALGAPTGTLQRWNEYMIIVSLALRQPGATRAPAMQHLWLNPANAPKATYRGNVTLTDGAGNFAPAFWVHQQYFFNADFANNPAFVQYMYNHQRADQLYCAIDLSQTYRYGLTAGVVPSGYAADRLYSHNNVYSPSAVGGWGDLDGLLEFVEDREPNTNVRFRYGLPRVSTVQPSWIPYDAGLVDHTFLMYGLVDRLDPMFFKQRRPIQVDTDQDGIADAFDNCAGAWNPAQQDLDQNGVADACECSTIAADRDADGDVDVRDFAAWQTCPPLPGQRTSERCLCVDYDASRVVDGADLAPLLACLTTGGPDVTPSCNP